MNLSIKAKITLSLLTLWLGIAIPLISNPVMVEANLAIAGIAGTILYFLLCHFKPVLAFAFSFCIPFLLYSMLNVSLSVSSVIGFALCFVQLITIVMPVVISKRKVTLLKFEKSMLAMVVLWMFSAIVGIAAKNDLTYFVGDAYRFLVIPFYYFLSVNVLSDRDKIRKFIKIVLGTFFIFLLIEIFRMSVSGYARIGSAYSTYAILACVAILYYKKQLQISKRVSLFLHVMVLLSIFHLLLANTRTFYLGIVAAVLFFYLFLHFKNLRPGKIFKFIVFGGIVVLSTSLITSYFQHNFGFNAINNVLYRLEASYKNGVVDRSTSSRFIEAQAAIEKMKGTSVLVGAGFGSTFDNPRKIYEADANDHFVHMKYAEILLRSGVIGLSIFTFFCLSIFFSLWKSIKRMDNPFDKSFIEFSLILHISLIVMSVGGMVLFIENHLYATVLGISGSLIRINRN